MITANHLKQMDTILLEALRFKNGFFGKNQDVIVDLRKVISSELRNIKIGRTHIVEGKSLGTLK